MAEPSYHQLKKEHPDKPEACHRCKLFTYCTPEHYKNGVFHLVRRLDARSAIVIMEDSPEPVQGDKVQFYKNRYKDIVPYFDLSDVFVFFTVRCIFPSIKRGKEGDIPKKYIDACGVLVDQELARLASDYNNIVIIQASAASKQRHFLHGSEVVVPYIQPIDSWQQERRDKALCRVKNTAERTLVSVPDSSFTSTLKHAYDIGRIGLDFEWSVSTGKLHTVGIATNKYAWAGDINSTGIWQEVKRLFASNDMTIIGHDLARAEVYKMLEMGVREINCKFSCGLIRSFELRKDETAQLKLKDIVWNDTDMEKYWGDEDVKNKLDYKDLMDTYSEVGKNICRGDAFASFYYDDILTGDYAERHSRLVERGGYDLDMSMVLPVANMMYRGISVDMERVEAHAIRLMNEIPRIKKYVKEEHGIDPGKPLQVQDKLRLYGARLHTTKEETLKELQQTTASPAVDDLITNVLLYRNLTKIDSTFVKGIEKNLVDGKIHAYLKIASAVTGRGSASFPNIEQFPYDTRDMFCSSFGGDGQLETRDRSQSEYRCVAYMSRVPALLAAYMNDEDLHAFTAKHFGIPRKSAKNINFAGIFDATADKLLYMLVKEGLTKETVTPLVDSFLDILAPVKRWQKNVINEAYNQGFVETPTGRRSYRLRKQQIVNTPIQGWSADLNKRTIIEFFREMWSQKLESYIWLEFHDGTEMDVLKEESPIIDEIAKGVFNVLPDINDIGVHLPFPLDKTVHGYRWKLDK